MNKFDRKFNKKYPAGRPKNRQALPSVMPKVWHCVNRYTSQVIGYTPGAQVYGAFDYYLNSIHAPDVSGTDTSDAIGYTELSTLYSNWLVVSARITVEVVNEEAFEIVFCFAPSTYALDASIGSASEVMQLSEMPYGGAVTLGRSTSMNRSTIVRQIKLETLVGSKSLYNGDQNWIGFATNRPTNLCYFTMGIAALSGNNLSNGITFKYTVDYHVKWSNRKFDDIALNRSLLRLTHTRFHNDCKVNCDGDEARLLEICTQLYRMNADDLRNTTAIHKLEDERNEILLRRKGRFKE